MGGWVGSRMSSAGTDRSPILLKYHMGLMQCLHCLLQVMGENLDLSGTGEALERRWAPMTFVLQVLSSS